MQVQIPRGQCVKVFKPRWIVFVKGTASFVAKFVYLDEALDSCIRAKAAGYSAQLKHLPE